MEKGGNIMGLFNNHIDGYEYCHDDVCCLCIYFKPFIGSDDGMCAKYNTKVHEYGFCPEWKKEEI
jgi:hypothetical protein